MLLVFFFHELKLLACRTSKCHNMVQTREFRRFEVSVEGKPPILNQMVWFKFRKYDLFFEMFFNTSNISSMFSVIRRRRFAVSQHDLNLGISLIWRYCWPVNRTFLTRRYHLESEKATNKNSPNLTDKIGISCMLIFATIFCAISQIER